VHIRSDMGQTVKVSTCCM